MNISSTAIPSSSSIIKLIFISGLSGSGKTTLGEQLKLQQKFLHFNVDIWAFGGDPIEESNLVPTPAMLAKRDPIIKEAFDTMAQQGFAKLTVKEDVPFSIWEQFFNLLCNEIIKVQTKYPEQVIVITFSVYLRSIRDYIRNRLPNIRFIILDPNIEIVANRKVQHLRNTAQSRNLTLSQFLRSFHPDSDAPDMEESTIIGLLTDQAKNSAIGFENAGIEEVNTLGITGDLSIEEVYLKALEFISSY